MQTVFDIHRDLGYLAIVLNALAGIYALLAWRLPRLRGRPLWWAVGIAEVAMLLQVLLGTIMVARKDYVAPRFHMFYGFLIFLTVGLLFQYRDMLKGKGRRELLYGLGGLFIMGLGIRAVLQVM